MRAAYWTTPPLQLGRVVMGTSQLPAPFESNPALLRPPLPSQCPTESMEGVLPHPVLSFSKHQPAHCGVMSAVCNKVNVPAFM